MRRKRDVERARISKPKKRKRTKNPDGHVTERLERPGLAILRARKRIISQLAVIVHCQFLRQSRQNLVNDSKPQPEAI